MDAIHEAAVLGAGCLIVHPGDKGYHTHRHASRLIHGALAEMVPFAADRGVRLVLLPMPPNACRGWTFLKSIECALSAVAPYPVENLGIGINLLHWGSNPLFGQSIEDWISRLALVQIAQTPARCRQRTLLGKGRIPLEQRIQQMLQAGYRGYFEAELYSPSLQQVGYQERLANVADFAGNWNRVISY